MRLWVLEKEVLEIYNFYLSYVLSILSSFIKPSEKFNLNLLRNGFLNLLKTKDFFGTLFKVLFQILPIDSPLAVQSAFWILAFFHSSCSSLSERVQVSRQFCFKCVAVLSRQIEDKCFSPIFWNYVFLSLIRFRLTPLQLMWEVSGKSQVCVCQLVSQTYNAIRFYFYQFLCNYVNGGGGVGFRLRFANLI